MLPLLTPHAKRAKRRCCLLSSVTASSRFLRTKVCALVWVCVCSHCSGASCNCIVRAKSGYAAATLYIIYLFKVKSLRSFFYLLHITALFIPCTGYIKFAMKLQVFEILHTFFSPQEAAHFSKSLISDFNTYSCHTNWLIKIKFLYRKNFHLTRYLQEIWLRLFSKTTLQYPKKLFRSYYYSI